MIADHFKWSLNDVRSLTYREYKGVTKYLKEIEKEHKKMERKAKSKGNRR